MKTLPLTGLIYEGPQARAYLARMRRSGYRFRKLIVMIAPRHPATGRTVARWMPGFLRRPIAEKTQDLALNYWPRRLRSEHGALVDRITEALEEVFEGAGDTVGEMLGEMPWERYGDEVERVWANGLKDPSLAEVVGQEPGAVLFTGGGILRSNLLDLPGIRFLHVHPGFLPRVRGADGLLWSMLVRGRPAACCFYMAAGIDTGEVIAVREFPAIRIPLGDDRPADDVLYRALFAFFDPLMRAELLVRDVVSSSESLDRLPAEPQDPAEGLTYHFMEDPLRRLALQRIFV